MQKNRPAIPGDKWLETRCGSLGCDGRWTEVTVSSQRVRKEYQCLKRGSDFNLRKMLRCSSYFCIVGTHTQHSQIKGERFTLALSFSSWFWFQGRNDKVEALGWKTVTIHSSHKAQQEGSSQDGEIHPSKSFPQGPASSDLLKPLMAHATVTSPLN